MEIELKLGRLHGHQVEMQPGKPLHHLPGYEPSPDLEHCVPVKRRINYYSMITKDLALRQGVGLAWSAANFQRL